jgi:hypothetical protein
MATKTRWLAEYDSPGTLFAETSVRELPWPDVREAARLASEVVERYNARPYCFRLVEQLVSDPVPDGRGGTLEVVPKVLSTSGRYFLTGRLRTLDDVEAENDPGEDILRSNMAGNGWYVVCENTNSWKATQPFEEADVLLDAEGNVADRGDAPKWVKYRERTRCRLESEGVTA